MEEKEYKTKIRVLGVCILLLVILGALMGFGWGYMHGLRKVNNDTPQDPCSYRDPFFEYRNKEIDDFIESMYKK